LLLAALVLATAVFSYYIYEAYQRSQEMSGIIESYFAAEAYPPSVSEISTALERVRAQRGNDDSPQLDLMLMDLLLIRARYYPDDSISNIKEAISLGQQLYAKQQQNSSFAASMEQYVSRQLTNAYLMALLPAKLVRWQSEVIAVEPQSREFMKLVEVYAFILADELENAEATIQEELARNPRSARNHVFAAGAYMMLGKPEDAAEFEAPEVELGTLAPYLQLLYADMLAWQGRVEEAYEIYVGIAGGFPQNPEDALLLLPYEVHLLGQDHERVRELAATAAQTTRMELTAAGAIALALEELDSLVPHANSGNSLRSLADTHPEDFYVQLALARYLSSQPVLQASAATPDDSVAAPSETQVDGELEQLSRSLMKQAASTVEQQQANLLAARSICRSVTPNSTVKLEAALTHFRDAMGNPEATSSVPDRVPDYDEFLLLPEVQHARRLSPAFDNGLNSTVTSYLNTRQDIFAEVVTLPDLAERQSIAP
jgi:hypothetical protein